MQVPSPPNQLLRTRSLRSLFTSAIALQIFLTAALAFGCLYVTSELQGYTELSYHTMQVQVALHSIRSRLLAEEAGYRGFLYTGRQDFLDSTDEGKTLREQLSQLKKLVRDNPSQIERLHSLEDTIDRRITTWSKLTEYKRAGEDAKAKSLVNQAEANRELYSVERLLTEMEDAEQELLTQRRGHVQSSERLLVGQLVTGLLICLVVGGFLLKLMLARLEPLAEYARFANQIGEGDLSAPPLTIEAFDEVGQLAQSMNTMVSNLRALTSSSRAVAGRLTQATETMRSSASRQVESVRQQVETLETTSVTLSELGESAAQILSRARQMAAGAEATSQAAETGLKAVDDNVHSTAATLEQVRSVASKILALSEKTKAIGAIVSTVNDLSERSNVLALNAAILAASSGDGKGFTVVAGEMKSLADQSKEATVEVRALLEEIERGIQACVFLAEEAVKRGETGQSFTNAVSASIQRLADEVNKSLEAAQLIVTATERQETAVAQVTQALGSIREASQLTSRSTTEFESSAGELQGLGKQVMESIAIYRVDKET